MEYDIGIIGGAGPAAGSLFFDRIIEWYQKERKAWQDQDFPSIVMVSYPFSDMLAHDDEKDLLSIELQQAISNISAKHYMIACNTLHSYYHGTLKDDKLIHLMKITSENVKFNHVAPLVLCTTTSRRYQTHLKYFQCSYPSSDRQHQVDRIIEVVLRGEHTQETAIELEQIIQQEVVPGQKAVLGCTELSVLVHDFKTLNSNMVDPCSLAVEKVCHLLSE